MTARQIAKHRQFTLQRGDVIKTHPRDGFWGCAVVLTDPHVEGHFLPMCHIGITPIVMRHDYQWVEIADATLSILERDVRVRIAPYTYGTRHYTCIGQYTAKPHPALPVIARIDAARVYPYPLSFDVGDGTAGKYPLCGPLKPRKVRGVAESEFPSLGSAAVAEWLRINRPEQWQADCDAAEELFERYEESRKAEERRKRQDRRSRQGGA
jgi:hypothetical protein